MKESIKIPESAWNKIHYQMSKEYPSSYLLIREVMKDRLGFVVRRHREWVTGTYGVQDCIDSIYLDFYDKNKKTLFLLKYSEFLSKDHLD